jgi:hypothetical protein|nr:MAG TPA: hypothetical protein [Caudoviricetes sp.]
MLRRIVSGVLAVGMLAAGVSVLACSGTLNEQYREYFYDYCGNDQHDVSYTCWYEFCDDPFTIVGKEPCPYEYDDEGNGECLYCGHYKPAESK